MLEFLKPPPLIFLNILYYYFAEFSKLSFDDVTVDDVTVARDMFTKRMDRFSTLKFLSSISIFDRHIFDNFVATVIRETSILVIFNVFMKYSALISSQNMIFNDEINNNGGRPYFDFSWSGEIWNSSVYSNARENEKLFSWSYEKKKKKSANQNLPICMKTTDIKLFKNQQINGCKYLLF